MVKTIGTLETGAHNRGSQRLIGKSVSKRTCIVVGDEE